MILSSEFIKSFQERNETFQPGVVGDRESIIGSSSCQLEPGTLVFFLLFLLLQLLDGHNLLNWYEQWDCSCMSLCKVQLNVGIRSDFCYALEIWFLLAWSCFNNLLSVYVNLMNSNALHPAYAKRIQLIRQYTVTRTSNDKRAQREFVTSLRRPLS